MLVPFSAKRLIYPPHPAATLKPEQLHRIPGHISQFKYDDWRILIYLLPGGGVELYTRRKSRLPRYEPPKGMIQGLHRLDLDRTKLHVLDGGLLHYKTERIKDTIVLWDILVHDGNYLLGSTYAQRYSLLRRICRAPKAPVVLDGLEIARRIDRYLWLAPWLEGDHQALFEKAAKIPELEGLVLKDPKAPLQRTYKEENNARWQIRARKPSVLYRF